MHSALISKIRCNNPNRKSARIANRNHLTYIGTREGVDLSPSDQAYTEKEESKVFKGSDDPTYLKYMAERPGSHGLFGNIDVRNINAVAKDISEMTAQGKAIYRGIVSLSGPDAQELGYTSKSNWELYMREVMPEIAAAFDIPVDKLAWSAAVHMEPTHPHCHYMFWRTDDKIQSSFIHTSLQNKCRELLSGRMFEDERKEQIIQKTTSRDFIMEYSKKVLEEAVNSLSTPSSVPGRLHTPELNKLSEELCKLISALPHSGRINYKFLSPELKELTDHISSQVFDHPDVRKKVKEYTDTVSEISKTYSPSPKHHNVNLDIARKDLYTRTGNIILKAAKKFRDNAEMEIMPDQYLNLPSQNDVKFNLAQECTNEEAEPDIEPRPDFQNKNLRFHSRAICAENTILDWTSTYKKASSLFYNEKDCDAAISILKADLKQNNILAFELLGKIYSYTNQTDLSAQYYAKAFDGLKTLHKHVPDKQNYLSYKLGKCYEHGLGTDTDYSKAIEHYSLSDNKYAKYALGSMYLHEKGIQLTSENRPEYIDEIARLFKASADSDFGYASYAYANLCEMESLAEPDRELYYKKALNSFVEQLKKSPNDFLMYRLGTMYYNGKGTEVDKKTAIKYFEESAEFKNENALYALGKIYADKKEVEYNPHRAEEYFKSAIEQRNIYAACALGELYLDSDSPLFSPEKGISILNELVKSENSNAMYILGKFYTRPENPDCDFQSGEQHLLNAVSHGNSRAQLLLGKLYLKDELYSPSDGIKLLTPLAESGNVYAQYELGKFYANQNININLAEKYLLEAAGQGNEFAQFRLAKLYLNRDTPLYDPSKAISYLTPLAESGNGFAQAQLGNIYLWGSHDGIEKNLNLAKYWLDLATEQGNEFAKDSWDFYRNNIYSHNIAKCSYFLFRSIFNDISAGTYRRKQRLEDLKAFQSHSKENQKAEQHKREI